MFEAFLPLAVPAPVGRERELEELTRCLDRAGAVVLTGAPGADAAEVARFWVGAHGGRFGLVWWIDAADEARGDAGLIRLAHFLRAAGDHAGAAPEL